MESVASHLALRFLLCAVHLSQPSTQKLACGALALANTSDRLTVWRRAISVGLTVNLQTAGKVQADAVLV